MSDIPRLRVALPTLLLLAVCLAAVLAGCGGDSNQGITTIRIGDLQAAPEQVEIDGKECVLSPQSQVTRDFMPGANPPDGGPLRAWAQIVYPGMPTTPNGIVGSRVYVINGNELWQSELESSGFSASDGPKWDTGILVDMVVQVRCGGQSYLIKASDVPIQRLD